MRLGRIILAGLAPLVSLSALAAAYPDAYFPSQSARQMATADSLPRLFQAVVPLLICAAESTSTAALQSSSAHTLLNLEAPLWLLGSRVAVDLHARRHQRAFLRC